MPSFNARYSERPLASTTNAETALPRNSSALRGNTSASSFSSVTSQALTYKPSEIPRIAFPVVRSLTWIERPPGLTAGLTEYTSAGIPV